MLVFIQFPIADLRGFQSKRAGRLEQPNWPPQPGVGQHPFVRGFGQAMRRRRGADFAWLDEQTYCSAARAVRFVDLPSRPEDPSQRIRCAFRRLFFDGTAVARVEIGISYSRIAERDRYRYWDLAEIFREAAEAPGPQVGQQDPIGTLKRIIPTTTAVPSGVATAVPSLKPLITQAKNLALYYARCTTRHDAEAGLADTALVAAGNPLVIVECASGQIASLGSGYSVVDPKKIGGVDLAFGRVDTDYGELGAWFAGYHNAPFDALRSFRLCLARLHAEQEVLQVALSKIHNGSLRFEPGTEHGDRLEHYLNGATRSIYKDQWSGISKSSILGALTAQETPRARHLMFLRERLAGAREQVIRKVERFERTSRNMNNYYVENIEMKTINIGDGNTINAPVTVADTIQGSFNTIQDAQVNDEVKATIKKLLQQITVASEAMADEDAAELAREADDLVSELDSKKPRPRKFKLSIDSIKDFATKVGEVGEPILKTCGKLLPLLVALFP